MKARENMGKQKKKADDYTVGEILEWVGAGPRQGIWHLTETEAGLFSARNGVVWYKPGFRFTRWTLSEYGVMRWEPTIRREYERAQKAEQREGSKS
jgi:hypothetical protein